jgi:endonuclease YncB( thermonuclease family)
VPNASVPVTVVEILSGDTFVVEVRDERSTVQLVGVIAPESGETRWPGACYAEQSRTQLQAVLQPGTTLYAGQAAAEAVGNGPVRGYIWYADRGRRMAYLINELIVADGYALADLPVTDQEIGARLGIAQNQAESVGAGLWGACSPAQTTPG